MMRTENQRLKQDKNKKSVASIVVRQALVILTFLQAHWTPIACAAGAIAAATMFGDKSYLIKLADETQAMIDEGKSQDAVKLLEAKISEYHTWRQENLTEAQIADDYLPDLYFQLAKARQANGVAVDKIAEDYRKAVFSHSAGEAFVWLYANVPLAEFNELVKDYVDSGTDDLSKKFMKSEVARQFEQADNWSAFKKFLEVAFAQAPDAVEYARAFEQGLHQGGPWKKEYLEYCRSRPDLLAYVFEKDYQLADQYIRQENFAKAAEVYEGILKASGTDRDTSQLKLTLSEALFNAGKYPQAISRLDAFIAEYQATQRSLVKNAILMKGRAYIQLGEVDNATDEFFTLMIDYPETKEAPEANFFIGYCHMLQGKFDQAKEAFNLVVKDYPESSYASKARLCLTRIENMTK